MTDGLDLGGALPLALDVEPGAAVIWTGERVEVIWHEPACCAETPRPSGALALLFTGETIELFWCGPDELLPELCWHGLAVRVCDRDLTLLGIASAVDRQRVESVEPSERTSHSPAIVATPHLTHAPPRRASETTGRSRRVAA